MLKPVDSSASSGRPRASNSARLIPSSGSRGPEVLVHELGREHVEAGGDRGVGGEDVPGAGGLERLREAQPLLVHEHPDPLEAQEGRMPLVHVTDHRPEPHRVERAQAPDPEHDLLADPVLLIATVELVRDVLQVGGILGEVRVEEEEGEPAHLNAPDLHEEGAAGEEELDAQGPAVRGRDHVHGEVVEVVRGVRLLLPAVAGEVLAEVALLVEQPDPHEGNAQVAGALQVVAGENPEAARVDGQALGQPVLGGRSRPRAAARENACSRRSALSGRHGSARRPGRRRRGSCRPPRASPAAPGRSSPA